MSKAEKLSQNRYPTMAEKYAFIDGYEQSEKDNSLSWKDMRELHIIFAEVDVEIELSKIDIKSDTIGYYQEILKRFKEMKEKLK